MAKKIVKPYTVRTTVYGVSVREAPDGKILDTILPNGTEIQPISESGDWVETEKGWIHKRNLAQ